MLPVGGAKVQASKPEFPVHAYGQEAALPKSLFSLQDPELRLGSETPASAARVNVIELTLVH